MKSIVCWINKKRCEAWNCSFLHHILLRRIYILYPNSAQFFCFIFLIQYTVLSCLFRKIFFPKCVRQQQKLTKNVNKIRHIAPLASSSLLAYCVLFNWNILSLYSTHTLYVTIFIGPHSRHMSIFISNNEKGKRKKYRLKRNQWYISGEFRIIRHNIYEMLTHWALLDFLFVSAKFRANNDS